MQRESQVHLGEGTFQRTKVGWTIFGSVNNWLFLLEIVGNIGHFFGKKLGHKNRKKKLKKKSGQPGGNGRQS